MAHCKQSGLASTLLRAALNSPKYSSMNLVLVRHGESVDNLAPVFAGVKDLALTNHGMLQAERLGQHFAQSGFKFTKIFSSNLQRAYKTAEAIRLAQSQANNNLIVVQSPLLQEQNFGWYEGKPFHARPNSLEEFVSRVHSRYDFLPLNFKDIESKDSMIQRMEIFIQDELLPLLHGEALEAESVVCIVSHANILSYLWKTLLKLFPQENVAWAPTLSIGKRASMPIKRLDGWSNTGYWQLEIRHQYAAADNAPKDVTHSPVRSKPKSPVMSKSKSPVRSKPKATSQPPSFPLQLFRMTIIAVNSKDHLSSLKRTRGGIGSSRHDEG